jgi:PAS domain S-box-containing protein
MNLPVVAPIASLSRRLALWWTMALLTAAAGLVVMWGWVGQRALHSEHEAAALRMATLFEASLRNAMLARDLPGLQRLIDTLGGMPGLKAAALLSPAGQVRFASAPSRVGHDEPAVLAGQCVAASCAEVSPPSLQWTHDQAGQALRVTYPVRNEVRCGACHGPVSQQPVNGVLVLDFSPMAGELLARQRTSTWLLPASLGVLALLGLAAAWVLRREVLRPVAALSAQVDRLASGDLQARSGVPAESGDELRHLAHGFDRMASQVQSHVQALRGQSEFVQAMIDAAPDPMLVIDEQHRIVMANVAYSQLLGHAPQAIIGQPCYRISRGNAEPCPSTLVRCPVAMCRAHEPAERTVMAFTRADGSQTDVEIDAASLTGPDGAALVVEVIRPLDEDSCASRRSSACRPSACWPTAWRTRSTTRWPRSAWRCRPACAACADGSIEREELMELPAPGRRADRPLRAHHPAPAAPEPAFGRHRPARAGAPGGGRRAGPVGRGSRQADITSQVQLEPDDARVLMDESELRQVLLNLVQNAMPRHAARRPIDDRQASAGKAASSNMQVSDTGVGISPEPCP